MHRDSNGHKRKDSYTESDHIKKECLTLNTELIRYSKLKNGKIVEGLKQKVHDKENSSWWGKAYKFDDLLSDDYSSIRYDDNKQIFFLEQKVDGKIKKGFVGVSFDWHFGGAGWRIWGYPNLKIEVNVPCEYDDLQIIDDNYALVKKDGKYGLLEFSFGKSNGDWDYNNRKRSANGKWREIVPCMYDTLEKASHKNNFIGKIGDEEEIITGIVDSETGESVIVANNYKKVTPLYNNVFLCELENGKKETVVINKFSYHHNETNNLHSISRISPCDSAEVINSNSRSRYLIKVTNDGVSDVYHENSTKETMEKFEENVADVSHIQAYDWYVIKKDDGHIKYVSNADRTIFTTADLGIEANNLSVDYLYSLNKFKVTNNDSIRICNYKKGVYDGESKNIFEDRTFAPLIHYKLEIINSSVIQRLQMMD